MNILKVLVSSRFKSFYWRLSMMVLATVITFSMDNVADFGFSAQVQGYVTVVLGLILGEISKHLSNVTQNTTK